MSEATEPRRWAHAAAFVACGAAGAGWVARFGPVGPRLDGLGSVRAVLSTEISAVGWGWLGAVAILGGVAAARGRLVGVGQLGWRGALAAFVALAWASLVVRGGHLLLLLAGAGLTGALAGLVGGRESWRPRGPWLRGVGPGLWAAVFAIGATFSMHRHWAFGSGSWDLGCMVHNFYRSSRGLDTISTVLGHVDFLGDHFMVGIYLLAPVFWIDASAYTVLAVQAASLAVCAPAVYGIARLRGASRVASAALGIAVGLSFGLQSAFYFDAHAITVGFGLLAASLWAIEAGRLRLATLLLVSFATFKESVGAYVVGLGLFLALEGGWAKDRARYRFGLGWMVGGAAWFVLVNRVFMPMLIARAQRPEPHETFADFGPTVFAALLGMLRDPFGALAAAFVPEAKWDGLAVTFAGVGGLCLLRPVIAVAALPLFAERLLSSKATMWQMGYHYAAPLALYAGWAAARALPSVEAWVERRLTGLARQPIGGGTATAAFLVVGMLAVNQYGYRHPANFHRWREPYFAPAAERRAQQAAVEFVRAMGREVPVAAQNRILPHVADRPGAWRLGDHRKADVVVLTVGASAWPYPDRFAATLARRLDRDRGWRRVFAEGKTRVFARTELADRRGWPEVAEAAGPPQ